MHVEIDIAGRNAAQRLASWRDQVADKFVELSFKTDVDRFDAHLSGYASADGFALIDVSGRAQNIARQAASLGKIQTENAYFIIASQGHTTVVQGGRETMLRPDDFTFLDATRPYENVFEDFSSRTMLQVPKAMLLERLGARWEDLVATGFSGDEPVGRLAARFVRNLAQVQSSLDTNTRAGLFQQSLDLLSMPLTQRLRLKPHPSTHRATMLFRLKRFIRAHLRDEALSIEMAAHAFGVTPRYVNMLLAEDGISFGRFVLKHRLDGCRRDLEAAHRAGLQVSEIAYSWGFRDASVFGRAFRTRFEMSPRDYRREVGSRQLYQPASVS